MTTLSEQELRHDRYESLEDIGVCERALVGGATTYGAGYSIQERLDTNRDIVRIIDAELLRRGVAANA